MGNSVGGLESESWLVAVYGISSRKSKLKGYKTRGNKGKTIDSCRYRVIMVPRVAFRSQRDTIISDVESFKFLL